MEISAKYHLTFLRHGQSTANAEERLQGQTDFPLTETGRQQARQLAEKWKESGLAFNYILSSPLRRATETAQIMADVLGGQVEIDPIWNERSFGRLENLTYTEIRKIEPPVDYFQPYSPIGENGESQVDLYLRACQGLQKLLRQPPGRTLVVSHGAMLGKVLYAILGITPQGHNNSPLFRFKNLTYTNLTYDPLIRQWALLCFHRSEEWAEMEEQEQ